MKRQKRISSTDHPTVVAGIQQLEVGGAHDSEEAERRWKEDNRPAIEAWNGWVDEKGLPLARLRRF